MKTITKKLAALGVVGAGMLLAGCAQSNEANVMADPTTGKSTGQGVTPAGAPRSSKAAYEKLKSPMQNPDMQKQYKDAQG